MPICGSSHLPEIVTADFDNIRVIEWMPAGAIYSPQYDHALSPVRRVDITQQVLPGAEKWLTPPLANQNQ
jgi:hypothetical protein